MCTCQGYEDDDEDNDDDKGCEYKKWSLMSTVPTEKCVRLTLLETLLSSCANMFPCHRASSYRL